MIDKAEVDRVRLSPETDFTDELLEYDFPIILENTVTSTWNSRSWTPDKLAKRLRGTTLKGVKKTSEASRTFYYFYPTPLENVSSVVDAYKYKCYFRGALKRLASFHYYLPGSWYTIALFRVPGLLSRLVLSFRGYIR